MGGWVWVWVWVYVCGGVRVRVCVGCGCTCVGVCCSIAQLVRESSYGVCTCGTFEGSKAQVTVMASYDIISLSHKLTHICFS